MVFPACLKPQSFLLLFYQNIFSSGQLLFDTGQTEEVFLHNIKELNLTGFENKI